VPGRMASIRSWLRTASLVVLLMLVVVDATSVEDGKTHRRHHAKRSRMLAKEASGDTCAACIASCEYYQETYCPQKNCQCASNESCCPRCTACKGTYSMCINCCTKVTSKSYGCKNNAFDCVSNKAAMSSFWTWFASHPNGNACARRP